jgi:hypothetical protein
MDWPSFAGQLRDKNRSMHDRSPSGRPGQGALATGLSKFFKRATQTSTGVVTWRAVELVGRPVIDSRTYWRPELPKVYDHAGHRISFTPPSERGAWRRSFSSGDCCLRRRGRRGGPPLFRDFSAEWWDHLLGIVELQEPLVLDVPERMGLLLEELATSVLQRSTHDPWASIRSKRHSSAVLLPPPRGDHLRPLA